MSEHSPRPGSTDEVAAEEIWLKLKRGKWIIVLIVLVTVAGVTFTTKLTTPTYTAEMVVVPKTDGTRLGAGQGVRALSEAARSVGIDTLGRSQSNNFDLYLELLTSQTVAKRLQKKHDILQRVYAGSWNPETQSWEPPSGWKASIRHHLLNFFGIPAWTPPSVLSFSRYLDGEIETEAIGNGAVYRVVFEHYDREFAMELLRWLHEEADSYLREMTVQRVQARRAYLQEQLETVTVKEHRLALVDLMSELEKSAMAIKLDPYFAADLLEAPAASPRPTQPDPIRNIAMAIAFGGALGLVVTILFVPARRR